VKIAVNAAVKPVPRLLSMTSELLQTLASAGARVPTGSSHDQPHDLNAVGAASAELSPTDADRSAVAPARSVAVVQWSADWQNLCARRDVAEVMAGWAQRHECLGGMTSLSQILDGCRADRGASPDLADRRLAALVSEAQAGCAVAHRLLMQRMLPPLLRRAAVRARRHRLPFDAVVSELMATAWLVVGDYPLARRPAKVAVNIVMDTEYGVFGRAPMMTRNTVPLAPDELAAVTPSGQLGGSEPERVLEELPQLLREAVRSGLATDDARLLAELYLFGISVTEIAARDGVTARWVRCRRQRAARRLAAHVGLGARGHGEAGDDRRSGRGSRYGRSPDVSRARDHGHARAGYPAR
jgi:hypothetical protein